MLCKALKIHHSVYYYHKQNKENSYKKANIELDKKIKEEFEKSKRRYGSPKIAKKLNKQGLKVSQKRVAIGEKRAIEQIANNLLNKGMSTEDIIQITKIDEKLLKKIISKNNMSKCF